MKRCLTYFAVSLLLVLACSVAAYADNPFSGSGTSGYLVSPSETWRFNADGGASVTGYLNDWGSPGVGAGTVPYGETQSAYGMVVTFTGGGPIDVASLGIAQTLFYVCTGSTGGGTTFCSTPYAQTWTATLLGPDTIEFLAPTGTVLSYGQTYFGNVFFDGTTPTAFTGAWLTPEPGTLALLGAGMLSLFGAVRRRRSIV